MTRNICNLHLSNNGKGSSKLLVYHKSKDSHHGSTSVVELNSTLGKLGLLIERVPSKVNETVTEVTNELSSSDVLHDKKLKESNKGNDLEKSSLGNSIDSSPAVGDGVEGSSIIVDVSGKVNSSTGDDVSKESKLGDTSVLDLYITKTIETFLVSIVKKSKRIEESKRRLDSKLRLESLEGSGGLSNLGGSESSSRGDKGGKESELHLDIRPKVM
mmetsp:Transcript_3344/g.6258  ORF Transcript_3344/g.6258 Transcript_3344/m.6258 type:complete len:215 (-) Transcript_3344:114-758(-)